ncbi:hypothetical protein B0H13DRAFT_2340874 [Mycena leptocephala]|nr:hypothetical protein B0H13DRAFT_2340874 [Mycena leptocephala]
MNDEVENHSRTLKVVQQDYHKLRDRFNELEISNDNLTMERDELAHQIDGMEDTISDLSGMVAAHHVVLEKFGALFEETQVVVGSTIPRLKAAVYFVPTFRRVGQTTQFDTTRW